MFIYIYIYINNVSHTKRRLFHNLALTGAQNLRNIVNILVASHVIVQKYFVTVT